MANTIEKRGRILELDAIRGIAAFVVVIFHYTTYYDVYYTHTTVTWRFWEGATGVSLFFILSGFVIFMTIEKTSHWLDFVVSRFSRLYPAYWAALIITTFALISAHIDVPLKRFILNTTMFQRWINIKNIDWSYWTLYVELAFYITILFLFLIRKLKKIELYGFVLLIALMVFNSLLLYFPFLSKILTAYPMLKWGNLFFAGILFYKMYQEGHNLKRYLLLFLCFIAEYFTRFNGNFEYLSVYKHMLIILSFFILFFIVVNHRISFLNNRIFLYLGAISYPLYLIHQNMGYVIISKLYDYQLHPALIIAIPVAISIVIASIITFYIEKPSLNFIRNVYRKKKESIQKPVLEKV